MIIGDMTAMKQYILNHTVNQKNIRHCTVAHNVAKMLTDFPNSFTIRLSSKDVIQQSLKNPPNLKRIATLPCEMNMSGNN